MRVLKEVMIVTEMRGTGISDMILLECLTIEGGYSTSFLNAIVTFTNPYETLHYHEFCIWKCFRISKFWSLYVCDYLIENYFLIGFL